MSGRSRNPRLIILALAWLCAMPTASADDLSSPSGGQLGAAVAWYLGLVEATIQLRGGEPSS